MSAAAIAALRFPLPLKLSAAIGLPGPLRALPLVYGQDTPCWGAGIPTNDKRVWALAGHHLGEILAVDGQDAAGRKLVSAELINTTDPDGAAIALARLPRVPDGTPLFLMRGKSGDPAAIIYDLLVNVAGLSILRSQILDVFSGVFTEELVGRVEDPTKSLRAQIDEICLNAGCAWSEGRPAGIVSLLPITTEPVRSYTRRDLFNVKPVSTIDALRNQVRVLYNSGKAGQVKQRAIAGVPLFGAVNAGADSGAAAVAFSGRQAIIEAPSGELEATPLSGRVPASIRRYGVRETTLELRWVHSLSQAARVLSLALSDGHRPPVILSADVDLDEDLFPGDRVEVDDPYVPDIGPWLVTGAEPDRVNHRTHITLRAAAGGPAMSQVIDYPDPQRPASVFVGYGSADDNDREIDETVTEPPEDGTEAATEQAEEATGHLESIIVAVSDETTPVVADAANALREIRMPYDMVLAEIQIMVTSNTTNANPARVAVLLERVAIADFLMTTGPGGLFKVELNSRLLSKKNLVGFYLLDSGDGAITGLKFNLVGRQP